MKYSAKYLFQLRTQDDCVATNGKNYHAKRSLKLIIEEVAKYAICKREAHANPSASGGALRLPPAHVASAGQPPSGGRGDSRESVHRKGSFSPLFFFFCFLRQDKTRVGPSYGCKGGWLFLKRTASGVSPVGKICWAVTPRM
mgnify:CR=1 FL=1